MFPSSPSPPIIILPLIRPSASPPLPHRSKGEQWTPGTTWFPRSSGQRRHAWTHGSSRTPRRERKNRSPRPPWNPWRERLLQSSTHVHDIERFIITPVLYFIWQVKWEEKERTTTLHLLDALDAPLVLKVPQAPLAHLVFLVPLDTQASPARTVILARKEPPDSPGALEPPGPQHKMVRSHRMCRERGGGRGGCAGEGRGRSYDVQRQWTRAHPIFSTSAGGKGQKGELGYPGPQGYPGAPGAPGERGMPGEKGSQGPSGPAGTPGTPGYPGSEGQKGEKGTPGLPGNNGIPGKSINCDVAACKNAMCMSVFIEFYGFSFFFLRHPRIPRSPRPTWFSRTPGPSRLPWPPWTTRTKGRGRNTRRPRSTRTRR